MSVDVREQQAGDEGSRQHEEHVDAEEPGGEPGDLEVEEEDQHDRDAPDAVERSDVSVALSFLGDGAPPVRCGPCVRAWSDIP